MKRGGSDHVRRVRRGSLCYLIGTFGWTIGYHVPRNDALSEVNPSQPHAAEQWSRYVSTWTTWNHVRVLAALGADTVLTLALRVH
jgi:uncharacterized membrane protein